MLHHPLINNDPHTHTYYSPSSRDTLNRKRNACQINTLLIHFYFEFHVLKFVFFLTFLTFLSLICFFFSFLISFLLSFIPLFFFLILAFSFHLFNFFIYSISCIIPVFVLPFFSRFFFHSFYFVHISCFLSLLEFIFLFHSIIFLFILH